MLKALFRTGLIIVVACFAAPSVAATAMDVTGQWQGAFQNPPTLRTVLKISRGRNGKLVGMLYSIDQDPTGIPIDSMTLQGSTFKFSVVSLRGSYSGTIGSNGDSITGAWTSGKPQPLDFERATGKTAWVIDPSPHKTRFITVDKNVKLEVLDWGGTGRPLIFLGGLGETAHRYDKLALDFTATNHVYAITRRGFGYSSKPDPAAADYSADRLGDDVLAVIDALKLNKPVLAGHSVAGSELSSIGSRHPEKVAGLIYLDAGYAYAYYTPGSIVPLGTNLVVASKALQKKIAQLNTQPRQERDLQPLIRELLETDFPQFEKDLSAAQTAIQKLRPPPPNAAAPAETPDSRIRQAIINGFQQYTDIKAPVLAIFAAPEQHPATMPQATRDEEAAESAAQANAFESGLPNAQVIRLPNANHYLWITNEADVVQDMNKFMAGLQ